MSIQTAAEATIKGVTATSDKGSDHEKEQASKYTSARQSVETVALGSTPPADGSVYTWT